MNVQLQSYISCSLSYNQFYKLTVKAEKASLNELVQGYEIAFLLVLAIFITGFFLISYRLLSRVIYLEALTIVAVVAFLLYKLSSLVFTLSCLGAVGAAIGVSLVNNIASTTSREIF